MRLFFLPISTRRSLIYCEPPALRATASQPSILDRIVLKANSTWADWEKNTDSIWNWKRRTTSYGNMMFRRIPYEEWGLKSIPPMSRKVGRLKAPGETPVKPQDRVEIHFPGLFQGLCKEGVFDNVKRLATERQGLHNKRMWYSIAAMPLTIPVGLLPIIPNLPFFYLVFRAYSHWRALSGSKHLSHMLSSGVMQLVPSSTLDSLYTAGLLYPTRAASRHASDPSTDETKAAVECLRQQTSPTSSTSSHSPAANSNIGEKTSTNKDNPALNSSTAPTKGAKLRPGLGKKLNTGEEEVMLLQGWNGKLIAERLQLPGLEVEIERAVEQVQNSIEKDEGELTGEKKELEDLLERVRGKQKAA